MQCYGQLFTSTRDGIKENEGLGGQRTRSIISLVCQLFIDFLERPHCWYRYLDTGLSTIWATCYNQLLGASPTSPSPLLSSCMKESQPIQDYLIKRLRPIFSCRLTPAFRHAFYWQSDKLGFACFLFGFFPLSRHTTQLAEFERDSAECFVAGELIHFRGRMKAFELINCESVPQSLET